MPTLAPPPPPLRPPPPRPQLELPGVSFFGRTFAEYAQFFALDPIALRGRDVLDVAAGPASFVAEACARRIHAVAVDPLYGNTSDALTVRLEHDFEAMFAQMRANARLFKTRATTAYFPSLDAAELERRTAGQRFLGDYAAQFSHGRYVSGALPHLPFLGQTFDLVLCAHLLFVYAKRFDFDWHLAACRELVRVAAGEVRIHPLCGLDGKLYPGLPRLRRELRAAGIASEIVSVNYEFFTGSDSMMVLRRSAP